MNLTDTDLYSDLFQLFRGSEGTIVSLVEGTKEVEVDTLASIIDEQRVQYGEHLNIKPFPLKKEEFDAFRYRISDVARGISNKQVHNAK